MRINTRARVWGGCVLVSKESREPSLFASVGRQQNLLPPCMQAIRIRNGLEIGPILYPYRHLLPMRIVNDVIASFKTLHCTLFLRNCLVCRAELFIPPPVWQTVTLLATVGAEKERSLRLIVLGVFFLLFELLMLA